MAITVIQEENPWAEFLTGLVPIGTAYFAKKGEQEAAERKAKDDNSTSFTPSFMQIKGLQDQQWYKMPQNARQYPSIYDYRYSRF